MAYTGRSDQGCIQGEAIRGVYREIWSPSYTGRGNKGCIQGKRDTQGIVLVTIDKEKSLKPFDWNRSQRKE